MFKLPISATTLALVCLCLSVLSAHAQQYFVDDGQTVQLVYSGRPSDVQPGEDQPQLFERHLTPMSGKCIRLPLLSIYVPVGATLGSRPLCET